MEIHKFATACVVCSKIWRPLLVGAAVNTSAHAQTLYIPATQYQASALYQTNVPHDICNYDPAYGIPGSCGNFISTPGSVASPLGASIAQASLTGGTTDPILHASASGNADSASGAFGGSGAQETLFFAINPGPGVGGPAPTGPAPTAVPLDFSAEGSAEGDASWVAEINSYDDDSLAWTDTFASCQTPESVCNQKFSVPTGRLYGILLIVHAGPAETEETLIDGHLETQLISAGVAGLDPIVSIDPAFLAAHPGYSLVFGATYPSSIPEPSTWAMLALGFLGVGFAGLRRHSIPTRAPQF